MPFTLSHAAAVLPVVRRTGAARGPLVASALVAGSFAPDVTYYADSMVPGGMAFGAFTHALWGVLTVDVVVTVALVAGWLWVREPLLALLPRAWRGRVGALLRGRPWRPRGAGGVAALVGWFVVSAVLGSATHVVWDAFTHAGRWGTRLVPGLGGVVAGVPVAAYVQYGTSAVALGALGWFVGSALRGGRAGGGAPVGVSGPGAVPSLTVGVRLLLTVPVGLCVLLGAVQRVVRAYGEYGGAVGWFSYLPTALFGAGAGLGVGLLLYGAAVRLLVWRAGRGRCAAGVAVGSSAAGAAAGASAVSSTAD
ncbi:DUF4184 family protein [Streptomyces sp. NPDC048506]|uniref:DUF4184 family protein n=1 Tax=Streptomyces sp. NPDC048506 TaxID=3155028 RepID=UPI0034440270